MFFYLFEKDSSKTSYTIPQLKFNLIDKNSFSVNHVSYEPIPVFHGENYITHGYKFFNIAYLPDVSGIPEYSEKLLHNLDVLIIDALRPQGFHRSHFTLEQSLEIVRKYKPKKTFFTNITCSIEHEQVNEKLLKIDQNVELAHDGLSLEIE